VTPRAPAVMPVRGPALTGRAPCATSRHRFALGDKDDLTGRAGCHHFFARASRFGQRELPPHNRAQGAVLQLGVDPRVDLRAFRLG
jgi:hypothetical protein